MSDDALDMAAPHVQQCSFCGKARAVLRALIAGPETSICNECVQLALRILLEDTAEVMPDDTACSFCRKTRAEVRVLIPGPGVHVCDECVHLSAEILTEEGHLRPGPPPRLPVARVRTAWWRRWLGRG